MLSIAHSARADTCRQNRAAHATRAERVYAPAMAASNSSAQGRKDERIRAASGAARRHAHAASRGKPPAVPTHGAHLCIHGPSAVPPLAHHGPHPALLCPPAPLVLDLYETHHLPLQVALGWPGLSGTGLVIRPRCGREHHATAWGRIRGQGAGQYRAPARTRLRRSAGSQSVGNGQYQCQCAVF